MGRIKNGKRKDKHKYPDDESPLRHEKNETTIRPGRPPQQQYTIQSQS